MSALKDFYNDRDNHQKAFEDLKADTEAEFASGQMLSMKSFQEDWNQSQFWYSDETAKALAQQLLDGAGKDTRIAVVSAPSAFLQLKNLLSAVEVERRPQVYLLEFDERFLIFKNEFVKYDFASPTKLPADLKASFDHIICDPPFLSSDCQTKAALTVRWLARSWSQPDLRIIVCTGERMEELIHKLYGKVGVRTTNFEVVHSKGLSNEFRCYANFENNDWRFHP